MPMNEARFAEVVTKRANERAQKRIALFRSKVDAALRELTNNRHPSLYGNPFDRENWEETKNYLRGLNNNNYPKILWTDEEEKVTQELFGIMDEMQKALLAPGPDPDDATPISPDTTVPLPNLPPKEL